MKTIDIEFRELDKNRRLPLEKGTRIVHATGHYIPDDVNSAYSVERQLRTACVDAYTEKWGGATLDQMQWCITYFTMQIAVELRVFPPLR
jgi:hypothetical protein